MKINSDNGCKPKVFIHVGHGKTGTSATQHFLALNGEILAQHGILYPLNADTASAAAGKVSSGNILKRSAKDDWFKDQVMKVVRGNPDYGAFVFSNEIVFWDIINTLPAMLAVADEVEITLILSVREPFEMLVSHYSQAIKRDGFCGDICEIVERENHLIFAAEVIEACKSNGIEIEVLNYSVLRGRITRRICGIVGITEDMLAHCKPPKPNAINRSLSFEEQELLKSVNRVFGKGYGIACSDALVEMLPDVPAESPVILSEVADDLSGRCRQAMSYVNGFLPDEQQLTLQQKDSAPAPARSTQELYDVMFGALKQHTQRECDCAATQPWKYFKKALKRRLKR